jgi:excisionase family DNA binding protein
MADSKEILTTGEAASLCGVSRSTLRRAVAQGHLKAWHTPGKHLRFTREACMEFARTLGRMDLVGKTTKDELVTERVAEVQSNRPVTTGTPKPISPWG